jgi:membrane associated rhomboid family serine protease
LVTRAGKVTLSLFVIGLLSLVTLDPKLTAFYYAERSWLKLTLHFFSHMVSHADFRHLVGNFIFGFPYMYYAEYRLKSAWKFLALYVVCGGAALVTQCLATQLIFLPSLGMIGSSGAIFGIVGYALASMRESRWIRIAAFSILLWHIYNQGMLALSGAGSNVAFAAHLGGVVCGAAFAYLSPICRRGWAKCNLLLDKVSARLRSK